MIQQRRMITILAGALWLCAAVRADMTPVCFLHADDPPVPEVCISIDGPRASPSSEFAGFSGLADLAPAPIASPLEPKMERRSTDRMKPARILGDNQNSLSLCLYGLLGLGLCWSAPSVNKLGGFMDRCYRDPFRIDRSAAILPRHLCSAPVACFLQPDFEREDSPARHGREALASLPRRSQFTPTARASRGPPQHLCSSDPCLS